MLAAIYHPILAVLFAFVALLLMIVILLQRGKGVGLAGAFGGAGGQSAFGAKTGDFLTWVTVGIAIVFLLFAIVLNYVFQPGTPVVAPTPVEQTPVTPAGETPEPSPPGAWLPTAPSVPGASIFGADEA